MAAPGRDLTPVSRSVLQVTSDHGRPKLSRLLAVLLLVTAAGCSGGGSSPSEPPPPPCFQTADFGCAQEAEFQRLQAELAAPYAEETAFQNQWGLDAINAARAFANVELAEGAGTVPGALLSVMRESSHGSPAMAPATECALAVCWRDARREAEEAARRKAMREAANAGVADIEAGPFRTFDSAATSEEHRSALSERALADLSPDAAAGP